MVFWLFWASATLAAQSAPPQPQPPIEPDPEAYLGYECTAAPDPSLALDGITASILVDGQGHISPMSIHWNIVLDQGDGPKVDTDWYFDQKNPNALIGGDMFISLNIKTKQQFYWFWHNKFYLDISRNAIKSIRHNDNSQFSSRMFNLRKEPGFKFWKYHHSKAIEVSGPSVLKYGPDMMKLARDSDNLYLLVKDKSGTLILQQDLTPKKWDDMYDVTLKLAKQVSQMSKNYRTLCKHPEQNNDIIVAEQRPSSAS